MLSGSFVGLSGAAYAQTALDEAEDLEVIEIGFTIDDEEVERDEIVVTGLRLKRDTFTSTAPI